METNGSGWAPVFWFVVLTALIGSGILSCGDQPDGKAPSTLTRAGILSWAKPWIGRPHKDGGTTKQGIDCSGLVGLAFREWRGLDLPRRSNDLKEAVHVVPWSERRVGDLVFFHSVTNLGSLHVGIYVGKDEFLHVSTKKGVTVSSIGMSYWRPRLLAVGRLRDLDPR